MAVTLIDGEFKKVCSYCGDVIAASDEVIENDNPDFCSTDCEETYNEELKDAEEEDSEIVIKDEDEEEDEGNEDD